MEEASIRALVEKHFVLEAKCSGFCYEALHTLLLSNQNVSHFDLFTDLDTCTKSERKNIRSDY